MQVSYSSRFGISPSKQVSLLQGLSWLLIGGLLGAGLGAGFAPWVWRESVALQLTAPGLTEFVKFLPEVRLGQLQVERLYFLTPLFWVMLALPLLIANRALVIPGWLRLIGCLAVVPLALVALSPVWTPAILVASEFRLQTLWAGFALGLVLIAPIQRRLPLKILIPVLGIGGIVAIILPLWQFNLVQNAMEDVYRGSVSLGWGWWLTVAGMVISLAGGMVLAFWHHDQGRVDDRPSRSS